MEFSEEKAIQQLIDTYANSFQMLTKRILNSKIRGVDIYSDAQILASVNRNINKLLEENKKFVNLVIPKAYGRTREETLGFFKKHNIEVKADATFREVHTKAVEELQKALNDDLKSGLLQIGRKSRDSLREISIEASKVSAAGIGEQSAINTAVKKISSLGLESITYKNGSKVGIKDYVKMATRSTTSAAINKATVNQMQEYDRNLVRLSYHSTSCPTCSPFQGRVYSMKEDDNEFPYIGIINNGAIISYGIIHPNCRHRLLPYITELDEKQAETKEVSNRSFEDNRTEWSKTRYKNRQKSSKCQREIDRLTEQNIILKSVNTQAAREQITENNKKIKQKILQVKAIKKWEVDGLNDNELFTDILSRRT